MRICPATVCSSNDSGSDVTKQRAVNWLKGSVNLLQHVYGNIYKNLTASYVKQEITGGDALSVYLINLMNNLNDFLSMISKSPVGCPPLVPLLSNKHPLNASAILGIASKLGRLNQDVFTFNVTDPAIPHLEELIMQFLSLEVNLTLSLPQIMGHSLLTYSQYLHPDEMNHLIKSIQPFSNQTSAGFVEAIISAVELLKTLMDAPNGDPTNVLLGYIRQIQEFVVSLCRLQKIEQVMLPNGSYSIAQVTDLSLLSMDFLNLLTPEALQNLTQVGPDAAQDIVIQKL
ncbi:LOW QUALITY PROTEIN: uncharacterized protein LOC115800674 [Archocentrus centrarchus]|uniref:LOW QUALITY PROTEIN: uncharacterized protein LOC115800674 n=1 Tax=Archocentrus centrarchus TaxID=63155 RepID=UPI0011EA46BD|nr:LOW QUALITY PROTEIN: uncharacterized protein LOC115800674 [Archocentrus centrarchus]